MWTFCLKFPKFSLGSGATALLPDFHNCRQPNSAKDHTPPGARTLLRNGCLPVIGFARRVASFRIISIGGFVICSACGYENQVGNRFCGMCGTPLPHPPLTAPGAQGTHSLTRVPVETAPTAERQTTAAKSNGNTAPSRTGAVFEIPSAESPGGELPRPENLGPTTPTMVPEVPLDEYVKNFQYMPPADPTEVTMRGDAHVSQAEAPVASDPTAAALNETVDAATTIE